MERRCYLLLILLLLASTLSYAKPYYGASLSLPLVAKEPPHLQGYQLMLSYDPDKFHWRQFNVYFDGGFSHFRDSQASVYKSLNIYSIAPVVRYSFRKRGFFHPFLEFSIGLSYLNRTRLEDRNLGIHFAFQDRIGIGTLLGAPEQFSIGLHAVHYSNAHLSSRNSGITIPLVIDISYRFS